MAPNRSKSHAQNNWSESVWILKNNCVGRYSTPLSSHSRYIALTPALSLWHFGKYSSQTTLKGGGAAPAHFKDMSSHCLAQSLSWQTGSDVSDMLWPRNSNWCWTKKVGKALTSLSFTPLRQHFAPQHGLQGSTGTRYWWCSGNGVHPLHNPWLPSCAQSWIECWSVRGSHISLANRRRIACAASCMRGKVWWSSCAQLVSSGKIDVPK